MSIIVAGDDTVTKNNFIKKLSGNNIEYVECKSLECPVSNQQGIVYFQSINSEKVDEKLIDAMTKNCGKYRYHGVYTHFTTEDKNFVYIYQQQENKMSSVMDIIKKLSPPPT